MFVGAFALCVFLFVGPSSFLKVHLSETFYAWISAIGFVLSTILLIGAIVKGANWIKQKHQSFILNLVAIVLSSLLLLFELYVYYVFVEDAINKSGSFQSMVFCDGKFWATSWAGLSQFGT
jgi:hypothetical protein